MAKEIFESFLLKIHKKSIQDIHWNDQAVDFLKLHVHLNINQGQLKTEG